LTQNSMYVGLRNFHEKYFGDVADLRTASEAVFNKCMKGSNPLFCEGWSGWPEDANQDHVLSEKLAVFPEDYKSIPTRQRRPLAHPSKPINGSIAKRKMGVGFVNNPEARKDSRCH
jgi:hypothetical protein